MSRCECFLRAGLLLGHLLGALASPSVCLSAGGRDLVDGWLLGPAGTAEFLGGSAQTHSGAWVTLGQSRLFGLAELPVAAVNAGLRLARWPGQPTVEFGWQTLGEGLFREDTRQVHLQLGHLPVIGIAFRSVAVRTGGDLGIPLQTTTHWRAALTVQAQWQPAPDARVQVQLWFAAAEGRGHPDGDARRPLARIQGWQGPTALAMAVDLKPDQTPTVSLEWILGWGGGACGLRVDPATGALGPVLVLRRGSLLVRTSHLSHPILGVTHRVQLGFGGWGAPRW